MKLNYYPETDSLYIDLSELPSVESRETFVTVFKRDLNNRAQPT